MKPSRSARIALLPVIAFLFCAGCGGGAPGKLFLSTTPNNQSDNQNNNEPWTIAGAIVDGDIDEAIPQDQHEECNDEEENENDDGWSDEEWEDCEEEDAFGNIMHTTWARIDSVTQCTPLNGAICRITATVTGVGDEDEEDPVVRRASLVYSVNGGVSQAVTMSETSPGVWAADIPAQASGARVDYYIRVADNFGNVTTGALPASGNTIRFAAGIPDADNSEDIVPVDMDLLDLAASFDSEYLYITYSVQGAVLGGTIDPPSINFYGIKITNPDIEQSEGLMVGKLWINLPISATPEGQNFIMGLFGQIGELPDGVTQDDIQRAKDTGMLVLDISKLLGGNIVEGMLFKTDAQGYVVSGNMFVGRIKRSAFGDNPSNIIRIILLTAANNSLDSFMPIPYNCSHFLTLDLKNYGYSVP